MLKLNLGVSGGIKRIANVPDDVLSDECVIRLREVIGKRAREHIGERVVDGDAFQLK